MAYDTKTAYATAYDIIQTSKTLEEAAERVAAIANVEGVVLKPRNPKKPQTPQTEEQTVGAY
ncbi:MAG: hypothetical protein FWG90_09190 [Oscillospiraceae bacterium]|nr:hypothetical protein [Oscillospiraceae bacterium]